MRELKRKILSGTFLWPMVYVHRVTEIYESLNLQCFTNEHYVLTVITGRICVYAGILVTLCHFEFFRPAGTTRSNGLGS